MNRKCFRAACLLTVAAAFSSCSSDDVIDNGNIVINESAQTITLAVANAGDNFIATRAARSLYSSDALQDINKVKVVIYRLGDTPDGVTKNEDLTETNMSSFTLYGSKSIVAQKVFSPWMNSGVSNEYSNSSNGNGRQASWTLSTADQITEEGVYMAYAVGYNDSEYAAVTSFDGATKSSNFTFPLSIAQNTVETGVAPVYEVFAGSAPFVITKKAVADGSSDYSYQFNVALTLHRQVAGTIGYFTNIPVAGNADHADKVGAKLRLVASGKSGNTVFAGFNSAYTGGAGEPATDATVKYVVNGYNNSSAAPTYDAKFYGASDNNAYTVYEVALKDWFNGTTGTATVGGTAVTMDTNNDGMLNSNDDWKNPLDSENKKPGVRKGTVLGSSFLFPFEMIADMPTFQLQLLSDDGTIIRYWNIRLQTATSSTDSQIGKKATIVAAAGTTSDNTVEENFVNYSILRNHLYSIGTRNNGDGGGNVTPDSDKDKAQPLNNETLILRVNDNWEMIHEMDID